MAASPPSRTLKPQHVRNGSKRPWIDILTRTDISAHFIAFSGIILLFLFVFTAFSQNLCFVPYSKLQQAAAKQPHNI